MDVYLSAIAYEPGVVEFADFPEGDSPVWLLGKKYELEEDGEAEAVRQSFTSLLWFTYRRNFTAIGGQGPTYDTGWGCMLRAGQMMLAQALIRKHLGRGWRWTPDGLVPNREKYMRILKLFQDKKTSTYSIHQISRMGQTEGKQVGDWFGPNTVAQALKKLVKYDQWSDIRFHVAMDNMIILSDIKALCEPTAGGTQWAPMVLVIPLRLGLKDINEIYACSLMNALTMKSTLGIIGGKPSHALYFVGFQNDELVFLDPHTTHNFVDLDAEPDNDATYHCFRAQRMKINSMDPSIALCFYIASEEELVGWQAEARRLLVDSSGHMLITISENSPYSDYLDEQDPETASCSKSYTSDDEFELL